MDAIKDLIQPALAANALGFFAKAAVSLASNSDTDALQRHIESLAALSNSDLVLLYEAQYGTHGLVLVADFGLTPEVRQRFDRLGPRQTEGAGGLRAAATDPTPLSYRPRTPDLEALGIRAYWGYPLWSKGDLLGQIFFGSRQWDRFHDDAIAVFAATTLQVAQTFERRKVTDLDSVPSWSESGADSAASKRQRFIAVLAHELRNPIAPIRSGLDLLDAGLLDAQGRRGTIDMMQRQVVHLVRLIDDLLDTVRLDTGRMQMKRTPTLLKDVVRSAIESIRPALQAKGQSLSLIDSEADVVVDVDPVRLSQAFVNILSANARQTPEGGRLAVTAARQQASISITFEDEGEPPGADDLRKVFDLFPVSPLKKSQDGLGIGLALVKGLVELNEGTVEVRPRDDRSGSVYTVLLPVAPINAATLDGEPQLPPRSWPSHRVLIVDDNHDAADTLALLFELDGHTIRLAHDGPSGVEQAREFRPEVILMDIGLPGFDGNEAVRRIRAQQTEVRPYIIALTGWGKQADRDASRAAGCDVHLVKPVSHGKLREVIVAGIRGGEEKHGS